MAIEYSSENINNKVEAHKFLVDKGVKTLSKNFNAMQVKSMLIEFNEKQLNKFISYGLMNILEDNYELNKEFHEILKQAIYSFSVANYDEKLTFEKWLATYY